MERDLVDDKGLRTQRNHREFCPTGQKSLSLSGRKRGMTLSKRTWKLFVIAFGSTIFLMLVFLAFSFIETYCYEWCFGDWLINYQGGIVRRGLLGELFFIFSKITGYKLIPIIAVFQIILYGIFIFYTSLLGIFSKN